MTYVQFYNEWHRLVCFSVAQVRAIYPDFHRGNFVQWQRSGYIVPLRQGWYAFADYIQQPDFEHLLFDTRKSETILRFIETIAL